MRIWPRRFESFGVLVFLLFLCPPSFAHADQHTIRPNDSHQLVREFNRGDLVLVDLAGTTDVDVTLLGRSWPLAVRSFFRTPGSKKSVCLPC